MTLLSLLTGHTPCGWDWHNASIVRRYPEDLKDINLKERLKILGLAGGRILELIEALGYT